MLAVFLYSCFTLFFLVDLTGDLRDHLPVHHIWHEVIMFLMAAGGLIWQILHIRKKNQTIFNIQNELLETKKSYLEWKEKSKSSASEIRTMIDQQFSLWQLSNSEKDVALLLIKGLSMKEIAEIRKTQEKTVRQQARTIYQKSGLSGRHELSAFFLEDILTQPQGLAFQA